MAQPLGDPAPVWSTAERELPSDSSAANGSSAANRAEGDSSVEINRGWTFPGNADIKQRRGELQENVGAPSSFTGTRDGNRRSVAVGIGVDTAATAPLGEWERKKPLPGKMFLSYDEASRRESP